MTRNYDPALLSFLPRAVVEAEIEARGAKFTKVTFTKKDGTTTTRVGMPKVFTRRVGGAKGPAPTVDSMARADRAAKALQDHGNRFWDYAQPDADGKKGFAFNLDRVVAVGDAGQHPE